MRFYTGQHQHYCGIDLHARTLYLCVLEAEGNVLLHKNLPCDRARFLEAIEPFSEAATTLLSHFPDSTKLHSRLKRKFGKGKALSILAHKIGRTVYFMLKRNQAFDPARFLATA